MFVKTAILIPLISLVALTSCAGSVKEASHSSGYSAAGSQKVTQKVVTKVETKAGYVFANSEGKTLYTFKKDGASASNCYDGCAASWPPFYATKDAKEWGAFTVIKRNDGSHQWAYQEAPLYFWVGDEKRGDVNGNGIKNVWWVASAK